VALRLYETDLGHEIRKMEPSLLCRCSRDLGIVHNYVITATYNITKEFDTATSGNTPCEIEGYCLLECDAA
jgi:hypothetical protein